jgi:tetratricopeptide (TPR) repeat protein
MRRSVAILEEVVDPEHPLLATHRSKLAIALYTAGQLDEALEVSRDSLQVIEKIYAPDHPHVAYQLYVYGGLNRVAERFEEAETALARSAEIYTVAERKDNPWLSRALGELAQVQVGLGKHDAAEESARRALAATRAKGNANPIDIAETELSTAAVLQATGTLDEALSLAEKARSTFEEQLGADSISVALAKDLLGDIHAKMGQPGVAERLYRQALAGAAAVIGDDNPALALVIDDLVLVLRAQGREAEAADFEQRARTLRGGQTAASTQQSTDG